MPANKYLLVSINIKKYLPIFLILALIFSYLPLELFNTSSVPVAHADVTTGLVGHWTFDNTTDDASGQGNHGTAQGSPTYDPNGKINQALNFDGVDDYVSRSSAVITSAPFTVCAWVKLDQLPTTRGDSSTIFSIGTTGNSSNWFNLRADGSDGTNTVQFNVRGGGTAQIAQTSTTVTAGVWQHYCGVSASATDRKVYLNAGNVGANTTSVTPSGLNKTAIGVLDIGTSRVAFTDGAIDDVRIYNRALSSADITELYNYTGSSLVAHYTFDNTLADNAGVNHASAVGSLSYAPGPVGTALSLNGSSYATVPHSATLNQTGNMTIAFWTQLNQTGDLDTIITKEKSTSSFETPWHVELRNAGTPNYRWYHHTSGGDWSGIVQFTNFAVPTTWHHVAFTRTTSTKTISLYIDGSLVQSGAWGSDNPQGNTNPVYIGVSANLDVNRYLNGKLDDLRIYSSALSAQNIQTLYQMGTPPDTQAPTVSVTAPTEGTTVADTVAFSASASDNVGVTQVEFFVDGASKGTDTSSPYSIQWDTTNGGTHACNGAHTHTLTAVARDAAGNPTTSSPVTVYMNNPSYCSSGGDTTTGLVGHWKFDGNAQDSAGSNHGTPINSPTYATGKLNQAIDVNGSSQYVTVPHASALNPSSAFTVATWFNADVIDSATDNGDHMTVKGNWNTTDSYSLVFYNNALRCGIGQQWNTGVSYSVNNFSPGTWYHVVCTADASGHKLYVNGTFVASDPDVPQAVSNTNSLVIGRHFSNSTAYYDGKLDDVRFYNRALGQDDIDALYALGSSTPPPTVNISASPSTIASGNSSTLTWSSTDATSCSASGGWSGTKAVSDSQSVSPTVTTTYTLSCTGAGGTAQNSTTVTVSSGSDIPPSISITNPANGATVSGTIAIQTQTNDDNGVVQVEFFRNGISMNTDTSPPYTFSWDTTSVSNGSYSLTARATDTIGQTTTSAPVSITVSNGTPPPAGEVKAFPTAEGFGRNALGGRGGIVCHVTDSSSGTTGSQISQSIHHQGTFRYCVGLNQARTIVFERSGIYDIPARVSITNPKFTIAGQTAPGEGVLFRNMVLSPRAGDAIIRHVRVSPGPDNPNPFSWQGLEVRAETQCGLSGPVIIDRSSFHWATDDNVTVVSACDVTLQWNIIAEGVITSGGSPYAKCGLLGSRGSTIGNHGKRISFHHNLCALQQDRLPIISTDDTSFINNVIYGNGSHTQVRPDYGPIDVEAIGNHFKEGPTIFNPARNNIVVHTGDPNGSNQASKDIYQHAPDSLLFLHDNFHTRLRPTGTEPEEDILTVTGVGTFPIDTSGNPFSFAPITTTSSGQAYTDVLNKAGARVPVLSVDDGRILNHVINRTGQYNISNPSYPSIPVVTRTLSTYDTDYDGMPNTWENTCGLNPSNGLDGAQIAPNGYTNLENFLNKLAGDTIPQGDCGGLGGGDTTSPTITITSPTTAST